MKAPLSWLREYVDIPPDLPVDQLAYCLTMAGLEVEDTHTIGDNWRGVTIARVTDLARHPRAESLHVATLDLDGRTATVVTAATNLFVGAVVPHVAPGGRLPASDVGTRTFQGITSEGMVCSGDELAISPDRDGIYLLEEDAPVGTPLAAYLADTVLDIYITPNRPDCMSIVGIAREIHALTGGALRLPMGEPPRGSVPAAEMLRVRIEDPAGCPRFTASVVRGVRIGPSPHKLQRRLHLAGVRPISNVVDVTNYVMLELGQPLHAFDRRRLSGDAARSEIVVRRARPGETLLTLDGNERQLTPAMLVVADAQRARSLAGVMGGIDSEIQDDTREVILEGASWDRASIRLTSSALNLSSEAGRRFGRGVDPELTALAVSRATAMTLELAGGEAADGQVDEYPGRTEPPVVRVHPRQIDALLGAHYSDEQVKGSLSALGFVVQANEEGTLVVHVPSHRRFDVSHRADLAEEVARVVGYEVVPTTIPAGRVPEPRPDGDAGYAEELQARRTLAAAGLQEVITYSLVDPSLPTRLDADATWPVAERSSAKSVLALANPMSVEQSVLRHTLLGGLLEVLGTHLKHRERVLVFELGRTWHGKLDPLPSERRHVGVALCGPRETAHWSPGSGSEPLDFFDLKGVLDRLAELFGVVAVCASTSHPALHPGRSASVSVDGALLGFAGQLHPRVAERFDLPTHQPVLVAELSFDQLLQAQRTLEKVVTPSRFPPAERDVAAVVDESVSHTIVQAAIVDAAGPLLASVRLFDVYRGEPIPAGRKSLAFALVFQAGDRTLDDAEVAGAHGAVEDALRNRLGAEIRGRE